VDAVINIYTGNLAYAVTEDDLRAAFEAYGQVEKVAVIVDRLTGRSKGFGFVEMPNDEEGKAAIAALYEVDLKGRKMLVREARPKGEGQSGGSGYQHRERSSY
jgi:RNA recognition motif-containing protein